MNSKSRSNPGVEIIVSVGPAKPVYIHLSMVEQGYVLFTIVYLQHDVIMLS